MLLQAVNAKLDHPVRRARRVVMDDLVRLVDPAIQDRPVAMAIYFQRHHRSRLVRSVLLAHLDHLVD